jgi:hypothetical protein
MKFNQKYCAGRGFLTNIFIKILLLFVILLISEKQLMATEASVGLAIGYDDNIGRTPEPAGSGFSRYFLILSHSFFPDSDITNWEGYIGAEYQDYFKAENNYQIYAGTSLNYPFAGGRFLPEISYEGMIFRDYEQPEDSINQHSLKGRFKWLPIARLTVEIQQTFLYQNYSGGEEMQTYEVFGGYGKMEGQQPFQQQMYTRDDHLSLSDLLFTFHLLPDIDAGLILRHGRRSSSMERESYVENGLIFSLIWTQFGIWEISSTIGWRKADYDHAPYDIDRQDTTWNISAGISRFIDKYELFIKIDWEDNDSSLEEELYKNMVTQCGISLSF